MQLTSPATDAEVALALRVLEGCCLLHPHSTALAHQHKAIKVTFHIVYKWFLLKMECNDGNQDILLEEPVHKQSEKETPNFII